MKNISKFLTLTALAGSLFFTSCETTELELLENPNALTPDQASIDLFLNQIQLDYAFTEEGLNGLGARLTRIEQFAGRDYLNANAPALLNGTWTNYYQGMFTDIEAMLPGATEGELYDHIGIARTLQAAALVNLVDLLGDVPWTQAGLPDEFPAPQVDSGASVYDVAFGLLDEAEANFGLEPLGSVQDDFFYGGNIDNWSKLVNTLRMKMYLQTRLVNPSALASFNAIVSGGNFISSTDEDFQFQWGTNIQQPNTRHPNFNTDYTPTGAGSYRSNWLMNLMNSTDDPRIRYYFFRQSGCTPGASCNPAGNEETLQCSLQTAPAHYAGFTFCYLEDGYWGRDHGNADGIPPDGFLRTAWGVYPSGGKFDSDNFDDGVGLNEGGQGAGISPFMLASFVDFMRAEAAMASGNTGAAGDLIEAGLIKSITKVEGFASLDPATNSAFLNADGDAEAFASDIKDAFTAGSMEDKWNILAEQYFVTLYGAGMDAYNFYRRTGYPNTLQPNIEPIPGNFPRSFFYPLNETSTNPSITQKPNLDVQVFWDTNPASPAFPASN